MVELRVLPNLGFGGKFGADNLITLWAAGALTLDPAHLHHRRRQRRLGRLTPVEYETLTHAAAAA